MTEAITFADLEKLLLKLSFVARATSGTHKVFEYAPLGTVLVFPPYQPKDLVQPIHLISTRKTLVENGLISIAAFDGFLEKTA
jgi:predicted RNA binding protein YcfA (HicA-like mRNA interferase family)